MLSVRRGILLGGKTLHRAVKFLTDGKGKKSMSSQHPERSSPRRPPSPTNQTFNGLTVRDRSGSASVTRFATEKGIENLLR